MVAGADGVGTTEKKRKKTLGENSNSGRVYYFDVSAGVRPSSGRTFIDERGWYLYTATVESKLQKRRDDGGSFLRTVGRGCVRMGRRLYNATVESKFQERR